MIEFFFFFFFGTPSVKDCHPLELLEPVGSRGIRADNANVVLQPAMLLDVSPYCWPLQSMCSACSKIIRLRGQTFEATDSAVHVDDVEGAWWARTGIMDLQWGPGHTLPRTSTRCHIVKGSGEG